MTAAKAAPRLMNIMVAAVEEQGDTDAGSSQTDASRVQARIRGT